MIVDKLYRGENLNELEIRTLLWNSPQVSEIEGYKRRWTQDIRTIVEIKNDLWEIDWECGLTEYQDNYYEVQPYRVKAETKVITTTVTEYIPIE